uniref:Uncharacterized protein n=1 Tax=Arundo donax TaxID=35708 RepID=A0A0A9FDE3_ARUDO
MYLGLVALSHQWYSSRLLSLELPHLHHSDQLALLERR